MTSTGCFVVEQDGPSRSSSLAERCAAVPGYPRPRALGRRARSAQHCVSPDYASNRRFFVYYTEATGDLVIAEFASSATDRTSRTPVANDACWSSSSQVRQPQRGPARLRTGPLPLYRHRGRGAARGTPTTTPRPRDHCWVNCCGSTWTVRRAASRTGFRLQSFVKDRNAAPEVWAYGLRNPWRFSFDRATAILHADVGQNAWKKSMSSRPQTEAARTTGGGIWKGPTATIRPRMPTRG